MYQLIQCDSKCKKFIWVQFGAVPVANPFEDTFSDRISDYF